MFLDPAACEDVFLPVWDAPEDAGLLEVSGDDGVSWRACQWLQAAPSTKLDRKHPGARWAQVLVAGPDADEIPDEAVALTRPATQLRARLIDFPRNRVRSTEDFIRLG